VHPAIEQTGSGWLSKSRSGLRGIQPRKLLASRSCDQRCDICHAWVPTIDGLTCHNVGLWLGAKGWSDVPTICSPGTRCLPQQKREVAAVSPRAASARN